MFSSSKINKLERRIDILENQVKALRTEVRDSIIFYYEGNAEPTVTMSGYPYAYPTSHQIKIIEIKKLLYMILEYLNIKIKYNPEKITLEKGD